MPSFYEMMGNVRLRLGDPRAGRPNDAQIEHQVSTQIRTLYRHKRNSTNPWQFGDTYVAAVPDIDTSQINAADFGTPLAVLTWDPSNPNLIVRTIPFFCPQNLNFSWGYSQNLGSWAWPGDGSNHTALRCAFYWDGPQAFIQFNPVPKLPCTYQVRYLKNANGVGGMALNVEPLAAEDCDIVEVRSALALLPLTEWMAPDTAEGRSRNQEQRQALSRSLLGEEALLKEQFDAAQLYTTGPRITTRWSPEGGGYGWW